MVQLTLQADSSDEIIDLMWKMGLKLDHHLRKGNNSVTLAKKGEEEESNEEVVPEVAPEEVVPTKDTTEDDSHAHRGRKPSPKTLAWERLCVEKGVHPVAIGRKNVRKVCKCGTPFFGYYYEKLCSKCKGECNKNRDLEKETHKVEPPKTEQVTAPVVQQGPRKCVRCNEVLPEDRKDHLCVKCRIAVDKQAQKIKEDAAKELEARRAEMEAEREKKEREEVKSRFKVCPRCGTNFEATPDYPFFCKRCTERACKASSVPPLKHE